MYILVGKSHDRKAIIKYHRYLEIKRNEFMGKLIKCETLFKNTFCSNIWHNLGFFQPRDMATHLRSYSTLQKYNFEQLQLVPYKQTLSCL